MKYVFALKFKTIQIFKRENRKYCCNNKKYLAKNKTKQKMKAKKWVLVKHFDGEPKEEDLQLVEHELPDELNDKG